ncbi:MAG: HAD-IA family hydrolase, partial [Jannaschia sp.]
LGLATGKSQRGLDRLLEAHRWHGLFSTCQCADAHPSKPHPSMILQALAECAVDGDRAAMVGDSIYDMQMALAAGVAAIGIGWGYHTEQALRAERAHDVARSFPALTDILLERAR